MFEYILSAFQLYQSSIFTLILFIVLGSVITFVLLFLILTNHSAVLNKSTATHKVLLQTFQILNKFLLIPYDPLSTALFDTFNVLKNMLHTYQYKYALPWTLVIGNRDEDKANLVKSLNIYSPLDPIISKDQSCVWNFFNTGVIMNVASNLVCKDTEGVLTSDEGKWSSMLQLLTNHRGYLPMDNIVLNISMQDILKNTEEYTLSLSEMLFNKIVQAKRIFNMNIPVYVMFTKMDAMPGFTELASQLSEDERADIFGWSSSFLHNRPNNWFDSMFDTLYNRLGYLVDKILTKPHVDSEHMDLSKISLLQKQFKDIKNKLAIIMKQLSHTGYDVDLFIRGIYFTCEYKGQTVFATKLFEEKIFAERGLTESLSTQFLSNNSVLRTIQITSFISTIIGISSLTYQYHATKRQIKEHKLPLANLQLMLSAQKSVDVVTPQIFEKESQIFFAALNDSNNREYASWIYPISLLTTLDHNVKKALVMSCQRVILNRVHQEFETNMKNFIEFELSVDKSGLTDNQCYNAEAVAFTDLTKMVDSIYKYKRIDDYIQRLSLDTNLQHLKEIILQLFNIDILITSDQADIYKTAMAQTYIRPIAWTQYRKDLQKAFNEKSNNFIDFVVKPEHSCHCVTDLKSDLNNLQQNTGDLIGLKDHLHQSINLLNHILEIFNKYDTSTYILGKSWRDFKEKLHDIKDIIGPELTVTFESNLQEAFLELKNFIRMQNLPILGFLVHQNEYQQQILGQKMYELIGLLNILAIQGIAHTIQTKQLDQITLNMNVQSFADVAGSIEIFQDLARKQVYLMGDNRIFYDATLNALVKKMDQSLFTSKQFSTPLNVDQIRACEGYIKKLLTFLHTQKNHQCVDFLHKFYTVLLGIISENVQDAYQLLHTKNFYSATFLPITSTGLSPTQAQDHCKIQLRQIKNIFDVVLPYINIAQTIHDMIPSATLEPIIHDLLNIKMHIDQLENNEGDVYTLHATITNILSSKTILTDISKAIWTGSQSYFAESFHRFLTTANEICDRIKYETYTADYKILSEFFNEKLAGKFPFSESIHDAEADTVDVVEFYELYDNFVKKYPDRILDMYNLPSLHHMKSFIKAMDKARPWVELLAKNVQNNYSLEVEAYNRYGYEQNICELIQWVFSFDSRLYDFRNREIDIAYTPYHRIDNIFTLRQKSMYRFEKEQKQTAVTYTGAWSILKMIRANSKSNIGMFVSADLYEKGQIKPSKQLKCGLKFKLMRGSSEVPWAIMPASAPKVLDYIDTIEIVRKNMN